MARAFHLGELLLQHDTSPGDWVVAASGPFDGHLHALLPATFPAYARVLHPAGRHRPDPGVTTGTDLEPVRWAQVAAATGRRAHAGMDWDAIAGPQPRPGVWDQAPAVGHLPTAEAEALADVLGRATDTPWRCWFAVWEGSGAAAFPRDGFPKVAMPARALVLFSGPLRAVTTNTDTPPFEQHPHLWWPQDRAWAVATDTDLRSTYLGASREAVAAVLADPRLEAFAVEPDHDVSWTSDHLNPAPRPTPLEAGAVRLMSDYGAPSPVWTASGGQEDPSWLGLDADLLGDLAAWQAHFEAHFSWDTGWDSDHARDWYAAQGPVLQSRAQVQLSEREVVLDLWPVSAPQTP